MSKVLVTGAGGFIGFHTCLRLLEVGGYEITGLDVLNDYYDVNLKYGRLNILGVKREDIQYNSIAKGNENFEFIQLNLAEKSDVNKLFENKKFDYVVNLAAQAGVRHSLEFPQDYIDSNVTGFLNIIEGCRYHEVKHLVFASSSSVYGLNEDFPFREHDDTNHPLSIYAASKKANEMMAHSYSALYSVPTTGLRFFTAYGPWGRPDMALFIFTKNILEGKPIEVFNHGDMIRDFTYVEDLVKGIVGLIPHIPQQAENNRAYLSDESPAPYDIYNIGNGSPVNLKDFIIAIEDYLGKKANIKHLPMQLGDIKKTYASSDKLDKAIGYKPETKISAGIKKFIDWYLEYYQIADYK